MPEEEKIEQDVVIEEKTEEKKISEKIVEAPVDEKPAETLQAQTPAPKEAPLEKTHVAAKKEEIRREAPQKKPESQKILSKPVGTGILKRSGKLFSSINYKLENENGLILLKIRIPIDQQARRLLNKKVNVWGKFKKGNNFLVVEKISEAR